MKADRETDTIQQTQVMYLGPGDNFKLLTPEHHWNLNLQSVFQPSVNTTEHHSTANQQNTAVHLHFKIITI